MFNEGDDIDQLFREAAQEFPLDATEANAWDDVRAELHPEQLTAPPQTATHCSLRLILVYILLLPLCWYAHNTKEHANNLVRSNSQHRATPIIDKIQGAFTNPIDPPRVLIPIHLPMTKTAASVSPGRQHYPIQMAMIVRPARKTPFTPLNTSPFINHTQQVRKPATEHYFYFGLTAAADGSFVGKQHFSRLGFGTGILLGYRLSRKIGIESGLLFDKKYFYTIGQYFNTSKTPSLSGPNTKIKYVNGNVQIIEVPLQLQYTFDVNASNRFYEIGGLSSYFVGHENDNFTYKYWNNTWTQSWAYRNRSSHFFSVLSLAAGYERKLGANTALRFEPYLKLPLNGLGRGDLKLTSTGLNLTIVTKIP